MESTISLQGRKYKIKVQMTGPVLGMGTGGQCPTKCSDCPTKPILFYFADLANHKHACCPVHTL